MGWISYLSLKKVLAPGINCLFRTNFLFDSVGLRFTKGVPFTMGLVVGL